MIDARFLPLGSIHPINTLAIGIMSDVFPFLLW
jgi:hypothetical protein